MIYIFEKFQQSLTNKIIFRIHTKNISEIIKYYVVDGIS